MSSDFRSVVVDSKIDNVIVFVNALVDVVNITEDDVEIGFEGGKAVEKSINDVLGIGKVFLVCTSDTFFDEKVDGVLKIIGVDMVKFGEAGDVQNVLVTAKVVWVTEKLVGKVCEAVGKTGSTMS